MIVLGLSFGYHDSTVSLIIDGQLKSVISEERLSLQKHDYNFPKFALEECLESQGIKTSDIDHIVYHEDPHNKFSRVLTSSLYHFPFSRREFVNTVKAWLGKKLWSVGKISQELDIDINKISYLNHHYSHAFQAFLGSGYSSSSILIVDAVGDWTSTAIYQGSWVNGKPKVQLVKEISFPNSIGLTYSAVTAYLGFIPNDSECSTMALAAFGEPKYTQSALKVISNDRDSIYKVDQSYFHFLDFYKGAITRKFEELFGNKKESSESYLFDSLETKSNIPPEQQRFADIASSFQTVIQDHLIGLARQTKKLTDENNLCYAGGVALNCVANQALYDAKIFDNIFIPPDPGDGGTAVGIGLYKGSMLEEAPISPSALKYNPYQGSSYQEDKLLTMIEELKYKNFKDYQKNDSRVCRDWEIKKFKDDEELVDIISNELMHDQVVGFYQGRFELGPRALGNRSILFKPGDISLARRVSRSVKERASFRPYALSMTPETAKRVLKTDHPLEIYRWMQVSCRVNQSYLDKVRGGIHIDETTRPQVCFEYDNPLFFELLKCFGSKYGVAALVNTSFNPKGLPIVTNPFEALAMFSRTDMNSLVINKTLIKKVY